jgi:hypothetical protein
MVPRGMLFSSTTIDSISFYDIGLEEVKCTLFFLSELHSVSEWQDIEEKRRCEGKTVRDQLQLSRG